MNFSVKEAYIVFKSENLEIQVSYSKFNLLRPKNVKVSSKTPLVSCLRGYTIEKEHIERRYKSPKSRQSGVMCRDVISRERDPKKK